MSHLRSLAVLAVIVLFATPPCLWAQAREEATVQSASNVLNEIMAAPERQIPASMLSDAQGLAIVPNVVKGGFVVGVRFGRGVVVIRDPQGNWQPPTLITLTGGSFGWQVGVQATDVILVFRTQKSVQGLLNGKFTIGADAAAAAGPVGRQAAAATDARLRAEILSYSRSRGLFAGVALDGSVLQVDAAANAAYFQGAGAAVQGQPRALPASASTLLTTIARYTSPPAGAAVAEATLTDLSPTIGGMVPLHQQLASASARLQPLLDDAWKRHLALPSEMVEAGREPPAEAVRSIVSRYEEVSRDPRYSELAQRPEFQQMLGLLRSYPASPTSSALTLPPPPPGGTSRY